MFGKNKIMGQAIKEIIINAALITWSVMGCIWFTEYVKYKYGQKNSISASAKDLTRDGNQIYFYLFIFAGISLPLGFVAVTGENWINLSIYFTSAATSIITLVGMYTGYNPNIASKPQNTIHVIAVLVSMVLFIPGAILIDYWASIPILIGLIVIGILMIKKPRYKTWKIEMQYLIWNVWITFFLIRVIIPILKLT